MPNGGPHFCRRCRHFRNMKCLLRNINIEDPYWTTCRDLNSDSESPSGPIYAIVCEVKNGAGAYTDIPYFKGNRADTYQEGGNYTVIRFKDPNGDTIELSDVKAYLEYYELNKY